MFKVFVLLALIAVVYSVPVPAVQNEKTSENAIEVSDGAVAGDKKEVLEGAESSYLSLGGYPFITRDLITPFAYYPEYLPEPILYTHPNPAPLVVL